MVNHERLWMASFLQAMAGVRSDDIIYIHLPLYHTAGFVMGLCGAIEKGNTQTCNKEKNRFLPSILMITPVY